jgi:hypothetical protein
MSKPNYPVVYWQNAGTTSNLIRLGGQQLIGFITPSTFSSTSVTFKMATDLNANPIVSVPVKDSSGSAISFTVTTSSYYGFSADQIAKFQGIDNLQLVGGSSELQGTTVQLVLIPRQSIV